MGFSAGGSTSRSQSQRQDRLAIPEDVQGLRNTTFDFLSQMLGGGGTAGGQGGAGVFGGAGNLLSQMFQSGDQFGGQMMGNALQSIIPQIQQQLTSQVIPGIQESGLLQGLGGQGSAFGQRVGQGIASSAGQFLQPALGAQMMPFQQAAQTFPSLIELALGGAVGGSQGNVLTDQFSSSRAKAGNVGIGLA